MKRLIGILLTALCSGASRVTGTDGRVPRCAASPRSGAAGRGIRIATFDQGVNALIASTDGDLQTELL